MKQKKTKKTKPRPDLKMVRFASLVIMHFGKYVEMDKQDYLRYLKKAE